jgi:hypothetical protein
MGAPSQGMQAGDKPAAATLLNSFRTIDASERQKHEAVLEYWLSICGDREFPPLHDLDPLEISDAAPSSLLLELIGGGEDAEVRHRGESLKGVIEADRIIEASRPSILASIAKKLSIVAISRNFLSFEDEFTVGDTATRCWVTLLPLSASGVWVDYVYALVSFTTAPAKAEAPKKKPAAAEAPEHQAERVAETAEVEVAQPEAEQPATEIDETGEPEEVIAAFEQAAAVEDSAAEVEQSDEREATVPDVEPTEAPETILAEAEPTELSPDPAAAVDEEEPHPVAELKDEPVIEAEQTSAPSTRPGFSKLIDSLASLGGFYGTQSVKVDPKLPPVAADEASYFQEEVNSEGGVHTTEEEVVEKSPLPQEEVVLDELPPSQPEEVPDEVASVEKASFEEAAPFEESAAAQEAPAGAKSKVEPDCAMEGSLQTKLTQVRAEADEARQAKLRANVALYEALSAAYDFALDAEDAPEEYLRLVEKQGLKIQLRSPMKPVVRLAFDGMCDDGTLKQLEAVLEWAFKQDLPRGTLLERIEQAGGIGPVLNGDAKAA